VADELYPCCQEPANLELQPPDPERPDLEVRVCKCGRRHFELTIDPATIGLTFA